MELYMSVIHEWNRGSLNEEMETNPALEPGQKHGIVFGKHRQGIDSTKQVTKS